MTDLTSTTPTPQNDAPIPNLMDLFRNDAWLKEAVRVEEESDSKVGAGYEGIYFSPLVADSVGFHQVKRLQMIGLREFRHLLAELNLGISAEAAFVFGQKIVLNRLARPESEAVQSAATPKPL